MVDLSIVFCKRHNQRVAAHFFGKVVMFDGEGSSSELRMTSGKKLIRPTGSIFLPGPPGIASLWNHPWDVANAAGGPCRCMTDAWHFPRASCCRNWWRERSLMVMAHLQLHPVHPPRMKLFIPGLWRQELQLRCRSWRRALVKISFVLGHLNTCQESIPKVPASAPVMWIPFPCGLRVSRW